MHGVTSMYISLIQIYYRTHTYQSIKLYTIHTNMFSLLKNENKSPFISRTDCHFSLWMDHLICCQINFVGALLRSFASNAVQLVGSFLTVFLASVQGLVLGSYNDCNFYLMFVFNRHLSSPLLCIDYVLYSTTFKMIFLSFELAAQYSQAVLELEVNSPYTHSSTSQVWRLLAGV